MTKADNWLPLYVADYRKDTARLSCEQHGAYLLLIMDYWVAGAPPDDDFALAQITRLELKAWRKIRPIIERFFVIEGGAWTHKRVQQEYAKAQQLSETRRQTGSKGGRPRKRPEKPIGLVLVSENPPFEKQNHKQNETQSQGKNSAPPEQRVLTPPASEVACLEGAPPLAEEQAKLERAALAAGFRDLSTKIGSPRRVN